MSKHDMYIFAAVCALVFMIGFVFQHVIVAIGIVVIFCLIVFVGYDEKPKIIEYKPLDLNGNGAHDRVE
ncbi:hypothetical protein [Nitrosomonas nitrosa]|uniref:hypothetical protein n=1 Tax=Nitrosomonas nitrosa TaxID=52442 RepID=UPI0023F71A64|nr:hypothetical protein [Nitrosomonas nitrosa]MCO6434516.1 hypothetical protein [Nitrosomonas nitrosa]